MSKELCLSKDIVVKEYPYLFKKDKTGKLRVWHLQAIKNLNRCKIVTEFGCKDGKMIRQEKEVLEGKNKGKKNETTNEQQMILMCDKIFDDKKTKEKYIDNIEDVYKVSELDDDSSLSFLPMLAQTFEPKSNVAKKVDMKFPCFVQPKLDGIRCLTYLKNNTIVNQSRTLKYFNNLSHINDELNSLFKEYPKLVLDGELYNHYIDFNKISGIIKKQHLQDSDKQNLLIIKFYIYDCFFIDDLKKTFQERKDFISKHITSEFKNSIAVETIYCNNSTSEFMKLHGMFESKKYEGTILRNIDSAYEFTRSNNLQKYKSFIDSEFEIIGYKEGCGLDSGTVIWRCKTTTGEEFDVRPIGTKEERKKMFENGEKYIGKLLTVTYQELSAYKIPRFPVGKTIRDYE